MEYGLWRLWRNNQPLRHRVLILVLMEYGLWQWCSFPTRRLLMGLNPCSNGIWSLTSYKNGGIMGREVLILVLMEYGLWPHGSEKMKNPNRVLILVLMEYGLWLSPIGSFVILKVCLNPCSNGIWSLTFPLLSQGLMTYVLILVLMEYGLWQSIFIFKFWYIKS